jgi:hypothetical protein
MTIRKVAELHFNFCLILYLNQSLRKSGASSKDQAMETPNQAGLHIRTDLSRHVSQIETFQSAKMCPWQPEKL